MQHILEIKHITKQSSQQYALDQVSLSIQKGDIYGLIGKKGSEKTNLIKMISQLIHASNGTTALFSSADNQKEWKKALKQSGAIIETPIAHEHLTAFDNLLYYCIDRKVANPDRVIQECLTYTGLTKTGKKIFSEFSLGMKQRLGIAIALIDKPDLLILDEPFNNLGPIDIKEFHLMIQRISQGLGTPLIISSHILSELSLVATKFGVLEQGKLVTEFTKEKFDPQLIPEQLN